MIPDSGPVTLRNGRPAIVLRRLVANQNGKPDPFLSGQDEYGNIIWWGLEGRHEAGGAVAPGTSDLDIIG